MLWSHVSAEACVPVSLNSGLSGASIAAGAASGGWLAESAGMFGCRLCAKAGQKGKWASWEVSNPIKQSLKLHAGSRKHEESVSLALQQCSEWFLWRSCRPKEIPAGDPGSGSQLQKRCLGPWVPPLSAFESAGAQVRKPADGTVGPLKPAVQDLRRTSKKRLAEVELDRLGGEQPQQWLVSHKKRYCMAEAQREMWRGCFQPGSIASIAHDKRKSDILIVFKVANPKTLDSCRGVLGLERNVNGSADSIARTLNRAIRRFATRDVDAPKTGPVGQRDLDLEKQIRLAIHGACADGNPADQNALVQMKQSLGQCSDLCRDKAHALRSVIRRPCLRMGAEAQSIMNAALHGHSSCIHLIDNSDAHRDWWEAAGQKVGSTLRGRCSLGAARQRFESEARPLWNAAMLVDRFISVCVEIANKSTLGSEPMKRNLRWISEKGLVLLAVQADCINEGLRLIRQVDKFRLESEKLYSSLDDFKQIFEALFGPSGR